MAHLKFELCKPSNTEIPHLPEISLAAGKSQDAYLLMNDEPVIAMYLRRTDGKEFQPAIAQAWLSSLVGENKNMERAYRILKIRAAKYPEYKLISKGGFFKGVRTRAGQAKRLHPTNLNIRSCLWKRS